MIGFLDEVEQSLRLGISPALGGSGAQHVEVYLDKFTLRSTGGSRTRVACSSTGVTDRRVYAELG